MQYTYIAILEQIDYDLGKTMRYFLVKFALYLIQDAFTYTIAYTYTSTYTFTYTPAHVYTYIYIHIHRHNIRIHVRISYANM